jgi:hypothetical protein
VQDPLGHVRRPSAFVSVTGAGSLAAFAKATARIHDIGRRWRDWLAFRSTKTNLKTPRQAQVTTLRSHWIPAYLFQTLINTHFNRDDENLTIPRQLREST